MNPRRPLGPSERRLRDEALAHWRSEVGQEERREAAELYRRAGEALVEGARLYESAESPSEVANAVVPVMRDLELILVSYRIGAGLRFSARDRDVKGN